MKTYLGEASHVQFGKTPKEVTIVAQYVKILGIGREAFFSSFFRQIKMQLQQQRQCSIDYDDDVDDDDDDDDHHHHNNNNNNKPTNQPIKFRLDQVLEMRTVLTVYSRALMLSQYGCDMLVTHGTVESLHAPSAVASCCFSWRQTVPSVEH